LAGGIAQELAQFFIARNAQKRRASNPFAGAEASAGGGGGILDILKLAEGMGKLRAQPLEMDKTSAEIAKIKAELADALTRTQGYGRDQLFKYGPDLALGDIESGMPADGMGPPAPVEPRDIAARLGISLPPGADSAGLDRAFAGSARRARTLSELDVEKRGAESERAAKQAQYEGEVSPLDRARFESAERAAALRQEGVQGRWDDSLVPVDTIENGVPVRKYIRRADMLGRGGQPQPGSGPAPGVQSGASSSATFVRPQPSIPMGAQGELSGLANAIQQVEPINALIQRIGPGREGVLGPLRGRAIGSIVAEQLGGMGLDQSTIELVTRLQRLITTQAFADGGKQLTPTEYAQFLKLNPSMADDVEQAIVKTKLSDEYLRTRLGNRIRAIPQQQQYQVDPTFQRLGGTDPASAELDRLRNRGGRR
jgi:hypothetical protein